MNETVIIRDGVYICPVCGSKRITEAMQAVILKKAKAHTSTIISTITNKHYMIQRTLGS